MTPSLRSLLSRNSDRFSKMALLSTIQQLVALLLVTLIVTTCGDERCPVAKNVVLSVRHSTNTGSPQLQARLEHPTDNAPWQLDIELGSVSSQHSIHSNKVMSVVLNGVPYKPQVPSGFKLLSGLGRYRASTEALSWADARDACEAEGSTLLIPSSQREAEMVLRELPVNSTNAQSLHYVWLGFNDFQEEGKFVSLTGVPLEQSGFSQWHPNQPDGGVAENCLVVVKSNTMLADAPCSWKLSYFCTIPL